jgi:uncharacterized glyoxalase superfamily protein PhnB
MGVEFHPSRGQPESLRLRDLSAGLTVNDLEQSIRFYTEGLGFFVEEEWKVDGVVRGVRLRAGRCDLNLAQDDFAKGKDRTKGVGLRLWFSTIQNLDDLAERARAAGITLDHEPQEMPWGQRVMALTDPDGFQISIANPM